MTENILIGLLFLMSVAISVGFIYFKIETDIIKIGETNQSEEIEDMQKRVEALESSNRYLRNRVHELDGNKEERF